LTELAGKSFLFEPGELPGTVSLTPDGVLSMEGADTSVIYQIPVKVTDAKGIFSEKSLDLSTGLQIQCRIVSADSLLEYGEPAALHLSVTNRSTGTLHDLMLHLSSSDTALQIADSTVSIPSLGPGATQEFGTAFSFSLTSPLPDQYPMPFRIRAACSGHHWTKDFIIPVSSYLVRVAAPEIDDGYDGFLDPGEVATLLLPVTNAGSLGIQGIAVHLSAQDTLVNILSDPDQTLDHLGSFGAATLQFRLQASQAAIKGQSASLLLTLTRPPDLAMEVPVLLQLGKVPVAIVSMSAVSGTPAAMESCLDSLKVAYKVLDSIPAALDNYAAAFVILGTVSPGSHALTQEEGRRLAGYLSDNGNLFLEGYHTWYFGAPTPVHPYFGYTSDRVPMYHYRTVNGINGTFAQGMEFPFTGSWNFSVFSFLPVAPAYALFANSTGDPLEIANDPGNYRTIGTFVEFGKLADSAGLPGTKGNLMKQYLEFFGVNLTGPYALFHSDRNSLPAGESVNFHDDSYPAIVSRHWEFPGGTPSSSSEQNPGVTYANGGKYDVKLVVSDGTHADSILKTANITVIPGVGIIEANRAEAVRVYPNPTTGEVFIEIPEEVCFPLTLSVYDFMGRNILKKQYKENPGSGILKLNWTAFQKGLYILKVEAETGDQTVKVILR
ncbi:MAG TPA: T9SS type A sorting domain-containing protein, partial [Bacteroidales bacterium]|nr:T9SS type A sorting domain-containing protein [Bacteroidales bacterium]